MSGKSASGVVPAEIDDVQRSLAFLNTLSARPTETPQEALTSYDALCAWTAQSASLDARLVSSLVAKARRRPADADAIVRRARELRELAQAAVRELSEQRTPAPAVLEGLTQRTTPWYAHARLVRDHDALQWADSPDQALDAPLRHITRSVIRALTSPLIVRARACAADDCGWWFLDDTKNHSRRWCDMKICGNRAKVRRFRAREK